MDNNEKWPYITYKGKEYAAGPDNGCFYRWCSLSHGICVGPVDQTDRYGNKLCRKHKGDAHD